MIIARLCSVDFEYFQGSLWEKSQLSKVKFLKSECSSTDANTLYITTLSYLTTQYKGYIPQNIVYIQDTDTTLDQEMFTHTSVLIVKNVMDISELFNLFQDIFSYYSDLYNQLVQMVENNLGLQCLIDKLSDLLGNPITVTDRNFKILAITSTEPKNAKLWREIDIATRHNGYVVGSNETYHLTKEYVDKLEKSYAPVFFDAREGYHSSMIGLNIGPQNKINGILTVFEIDTPFDNATSDLIVFFSHILSLELQKNELLLLNDESKLALLIADLLNGETLSHNDVDKLFKYFNYPLSNNYTVVVIKSPSWASDSNYELTLLRSKFLSLIKCSTCIIFKRSIVMIFDSSSLCTFDYDLPKFEELLSTTMTCAGMSSPLCDILELRRGYVEANKAVELGLHMNADGPIYRYADFQLYHLIDLCSKQENIEKFCHPALAKLAAYDQELAKTLCIYLRNNGSQAKTAKELWIHRSSLIYRLKKIEEILEINLNDYKTRLHLQLSYEIFNYLHSDHITSTF